MFEKKNHAYDIRISTTSKLNLFLHERRSFDVTSFADTVDESRKLNGSQRFLIPADVFTRAVWQLIEIYGHTFVTLHQMNPS